MDVLLVGNEDLIPPEPEHHAGRRRPGRCRGNRCRARLQAGAGWSRAGAATDVKLGCRMGGLALATAARCRWPCVGTVLISGADAAGSELGRDDGSPPKPLRRPLLVRLIAEIAVEQAAAHRSSGHMAEANFRNNMNRGDIGWPFSLGNARPVEAVIFNMDGLLLDTDKLTVRTLAAAACSMGVEMPEAFRCSLTDVPAGQSRRTADCHGGPGFPVQAYFESADRYMSEAVEAGGLRPKHGVRELLTWLEARGVPKAVATSSGRARTEHHLWIAGIYRDFGTVVACDNLERGKPHPDARLCAARKLGVPPARCLALESSHNGVRAAHGAGMQVVMVPDLLGPTDEMRAKCEAALPDLHAVRELLGRADASRPEFALAEAD